jgi:hypothetical protein
MVLGTCSQLLFLPLFVCRHICGLFPSCVHLGTTCSLYKRVYPYQLGTSSSDLFGSFFAYMSMDMCQACEWNSQQLTESKTPVQPLWPTEREISSQSLFQCSLGGMNRPHTFMAQSSWGYAWGSRTSISSLLRLLPKRLGKFARPRS